MLYEKCSGTARGSIWVQYGDFYIRPVPGPRPVEELTEDTLTEISEDIEKIQNPSSKIDYFEGLRDILKKLDEIRSQPRETEKERWIRKYCEKNKCSWGTNNHLSDAWDAAYEAGRKEK